MNRQDLNLLSDLLSRLYEEVEDEKMREAIARVHEHVDDLEDLAYRQGVTLRGRR